VGYREGAINGLVGYREGAINVYTTEDAAALTEDCMDAAALTEDCPTRHRHVGWPSGGVGTGRLHQMQQLEGGRIVRPVDCRWLESLPRMKLSFKQTTPRMKLSFKQTTPRMKLSFKQTTPRMKLSFKQTTDSVTRLTRGLQQLEGGRIVRQTDDSSYPGLTTA
jgi:hypothetical protein